MLLPDMRLTPHFLRSLSGGSACVNANVQARSSQFLQTLSTWPPGIKSVQIRRRGCVNTAGDPRWINQE